MTVRKRKRKDKDGKMVESKDWYGRLTVGGRRRWVPLTLDKRESERMLRALAVEADRAARGLVDPFEKHLRRPLSEHVADFETHLRAEDADHYVSRRMSNLRKVVKACGFATAADLDRARVEVFLKRLKDKGNSAATRNGYSGAAKQFSRWLMEERRTPDHRLVGLKSANVTTDRWRERRAATPDELVRLIETARTGPDCLGVAGEERALLYRFNVSAGLRGTELDALTWTDFDFGPDDPTVTITNRKGDRVDVHPIRSDVAADMQAWMERRGDPPTAKVWNIPKRSRSSGHRLANLVKFDLKRAGIPYQDADGKYLDFYATRHTYVTWVVDTGAHPREAQRLARHRSIDVTMNTYCKPNIARERAAINGLPKLDGPSAADERVA